MNNYFSSVERTYRRNAKPLPKEPNALIAHVRVCDRSERQLSSLIIRLVCLLIAAAFCCQAARAAVFSDSASAISEEKQTHINSLIDAAKSAGKDYVQIDDMRFKISHLLEMGFVGPKWTQGMVYVEFADDVTGAQRALWWSAAIEWSNKTGICFVSRNGEQNYIRVITVSGSCWSYLGMHGGEQEMGIDWQWAGKYVIAHEIGHAIGLHHEHQRSDRDYYVNILWDNIAPEGYDQFTVDSTENWGSYDFDSIMHYRKKAFTRNGNNTIEPRGEYYSYWIDRIGQDTHLSTSDGWGTFYQYNVPADAVDCPGLSFDFSGYSNVWKTQSSIYYMDGDAAQSGNINDDEYCSITAEVNLQNQCTLKFYWKVSSEPFDYDQLKIIIDGYERDHISGEVDWTEKQYTLASGSHTLEWRYEKDYSYYYGSDAGWVDYVRFISETPTVSTPEISPASETYYDSVTVYITCGTAGAIIRYTTDGSDPTEGSTEYIAPFSLSSSATVKARAYKSGMLESASAECSYTIVSSAQVATPIIFPGPGFYYYDEDEPVTVTLSCDTPGADIHYLLYVNFLQEVTRSHPLYTEPIIISNLSGLVVRAFKDGMLDSDERAAFYCPRTSKPLIYPDSDTYYDSVTVYMYCWSSGATIRYTTDGSDPTENSTAYTGHFSLSSSATVKAKSFKSGLFQSTTVTGSYTIAVYPVSSLNPSSIDFGSVTVGSIRDLSFVIQNIGGGSLSGNASVSSPFSIVSGNSYSLGHGQSQVVPVRFSPSSAGYISQNITFTSGDRATLTVSGTGVISVPPAPRVSASYGTFTDKVRITWTTSAGATSYEVYRNTSGTSVSASKLAETSSTIYDDTSVATGITYYYWVKAKNAHGTSDFSGAAIGCILYAPTGVSASDGAYTDKVRVTWDSVSYATTSYEVWRYTSNNSRSATKISALPSSFLLYDDTTAAAGTTYYYWIKAKNYSYDTSGFSTSDSGYIFSTPSPPHSPPKNVSASQSVYCNKVRVSWSEVSGAQYYEVWRRSTSNPNNTNTMDADTQAGENEDDSLSFVSGEMQFYGQEDADPENHIWDGPAVSSTFTNNDAEQRSGMMAQAGYESSQGAGNTDYTHITDISGTFVDDESAYALSYDYTYKIKAVNTYGASDFSSEVQGWPRSGPDVQILGGNGPITIKQGTDAPVTFHLNPASGDNGKYCDWWAVWLSPTGWHYFGQYGSSWRWISVNDIPSLRPGLQDYLGYLPGVTLDNAGYLNPGTHIYYFGYDAADGILNSDVVYDSVTVTVE